MVELNHGKISVIKGQRRKIFDEKIILNEFLKDNNNASEELIKMESSRFQRAHTVIAILSTPELDHKIPEWEQVLSAGAVCTTILYAAQALGYAAQWVTEWYAYNKNIIEELGGDPMKDKIAGFIYIGHKKEEPVERKRPDPNNIITFI